MQQKMNRSVIVTGAAGFIGSHLVDRLLRGGVRVIGIDNLSRGTMKNLNIAADGDFIFVQADLAGDESVMQKLALRLEPYAADSVWHMAANSDIPAGVSDPRIDLKDTFQTTFNTLQLMRRLRIQKIAFASSSAIYGFVEGPIAEDTGPLLPISNYGAFKLASEAVICAAAESFLAHALIFRFPNVIGPRATHGVIFDLLHKLLRRQDELEVLGDGNQQKPYLHVTELLDAMLFIEQNAPEKIAVYNIGADDEGVTVGTIAAEVIAVAASGTRIRYTGGDRGWVGDVPRFTYSTKKLSQLGWRPRLSSRDAIRRAVREIAKEVAP